jgi:acyl-coenzyme A thioesterase PaaI-like protein
MPNHFLRLVLHPFKYRLFLMSKLPAAYFSGVRVQYADESKAVVTVPYKWFTTNPFKSTYFACLSMAAEMSTGLLAMAHTYRQDPPMSMLIIKTEGSFMKKATGLTTFTCEDGMAIQHIIKEAMSSGKSTSIAARSVGKDKNGDVVAEFTFTWSFKTKKPTAFVTTS